MDEGWIGKFRWVSWWRWTKLSLEEEKCVASVSLYVRVCACACQCEPERGVCVCVLVLRR